MEESILNMDDITIIRTVYPFKVFKSVLRHIHTGQKRMNLIIDTSHNFLFLFLKECM